MRALKQFILGALTLAVLIFLFRSFFCQFFCPTSPTVCQVPNPTVEFNVQGGNFGLTANPVSGATSVTIDVIGQGGALATSVSPAIGTKEIINVPNAQRPLQLIFTYKSSTNAVVARDSILIDDRENGGVPVVEVVMGVHQGAQQSCPNITNAVTVTPASPFISKFTWAPGKQYKITVVHGSTEVIILKTALNGTCYKAILWEQAEYGCLTASTFTQLSSTEVQLTTSNGNVKVTGMDVCFGGSSREISIKSSTPGATITVLSD